MSVQRLGVNFEYNNLHEMRITNIISDFIRDRTFVLPRDAIETILVNPLKFIIELIEYNRG